MKNPLGFVLSVVEFFMINKAALFKVFHNKTMWRESRLGARGS
jgi:hypothetical protein